MNQIEYYKDRRDALEAEIYELEQELNSMLSGFLVICNRKIKDQNYHSYYKELQTENNEKVRLYIPKERFDEAKVLAQKAYKSRILMDKKNELKCIDNYLKYRKNERFTELLASNSPYRPLLVDSLTASADWEYEPYEKSTEHPEHLIVKAPKGDFVRSKSEAMIAQILFSKNIPYRYENIHTISGFQIATDFTILHPRTQEIILWEHFGLSDNPDYQRTIEFKLIKYLQAGYLPGHNLIMTFEDKAHPLSFIEVDDLVNKHFS